jgi:hypothetical protein
LSKNGARNLLQIVFQSAAYPVDAGTVVFWRKGSKGGSSGCGIGRLAVIDKQDVAHRNALHPVNGKPGSWSNPSERPLVLGQADFFHQCCAMAAFCTSGPCRFGHSGWCSAKASQDRLTHWCDQSARLLPPALHWWVNLQPKTQIDHAPHRQQPSFEKAYRQRTVIAIEMIGRDIDKQLPPPSERVDRSGNLESSST